QFNLICFENQETSIVDVTNGSTLIYGFYPAQGGTLNGHRWLWSRNLANVPAGSAATTYPVCPANGTITYGGNSTWKSFQCASAPTRDNVTSSLVAVYGEYNNPCVQGVNCGDGLQFRFSSVLCPTFDPNTSSCFYSPAGFVSYILRGPPGGNVSLGL